MPHPRTRHLFPSGTLPVPLRSSPSADTEPEPDPDPDPDPDPNPTPFSLAKVVTHRCAEADIG